jgi:hypothetical protein
MFSSFIGSFYKQLSLCCSYPCVASNFYKPTFWAKENSQYSVRICILSFFESVLDIRTRTDAGMSDVYIFFDIPYKIIDTSTPHIIKTKNGGIHTSGTRNYTKEVNTLTNITTYTGQDTLYAGEDGKVTIAANMKATAYPNGTAILEARQR